MYFLLDMIPFNINRKSTENKQMVRPKQTMFKHNHKHKHIWTRHNFNFPAPRE